VAIAHRLDLAGGHADTFALGWLAREDKIEITSDKRSFRIQLK
jgi:hypothetical protein